jgi:hypothetical protein
MGFDKDPAWKITDINSKFKWVGYFLKFNVLLNQAYLSIYINGKKELHRN